MNEIISLSGVDIYQGDSVILSDVNIRVNRGEFLYLVGKTGFGKSSLLKTLYGDLHLQKGEAIVCGYDLRKITAKEIPFLRRKLGIVFQDFQLLTDRTVEDNLRFVLEATGWQNKEEMKDRMAEVLDLVNLGTKLHKMPHALSGGEQQRVVIARALLNHPELILADEPTGNLDPESSEEIVTLLMRISKEKNTAIVMASHDFMMIHKFPAHTLRCEDGKVIEENQIATAPATPHSGGWKTEDQAAPPAPGSSAE